MSVYTKRQSKQILTASLVSAIQTTCPIQLILFVLNALRITCSMYEGVFKSFRTGRLERELQIVQLSVTRFSCITSLWVSLVSFAAMTVCVASQRVFIVVSVYFVIDWVRKLLDTPSYQHDFKLYTQFMLSILNKWCIVEPVHSLKGATPSPTPPTLDLLLPG
jgi:hypothetical protein